MVGRLNSPAPPKVEKFGRAFAIGDKVMQIENDYMIVVKPRCRMLLKLNASSKNSKACNAPAFPASASQINAMVSLQYRIERHGVADDLGGSGNLGSGELIRFASCSLMPLLMVSAQLDDAVKIF